MSDVSTANHWKERKETIFPLKSESMCAIQNRRDAYGFPTLGLFKPASFSLAIEESDQPQWSDAQLATLRQRDLFDDDPPEELEKIPFDFFYTFRCNDSACKGHRMKCTDWEMGQSWRKWRTEYGAGWQTAFRDTYERKMIEDYDTHVFIIVGLFYPPKYAELPLFGSDYGKA